MEKIALDLLSETEALVRLLHRLPENHGQRTFLEIEVYKRSAGIRGEERLERKFNEFYWEGDYKFLRNISLAIGNWKVQIDGLLLTERGAVIIESKNISGKLHFDEVNGEFSRIDRDGLRTVMEDPIIQLNKHTRFLTEFFKLRKINLPIKGLIVFTPKECEFLTKPKSDYVCKTYQMVDYLLRMLQTFPPETTQINVVKISKILQKHNSPYKRIPLCQQYYINPEDLRTGILCTECKQHKIIRKNKLGWICANCNTIDQLSFQRAIQEYFSLVNSEINNTQLREFCQITSVFAASRLLSTLDLEPKGALRNRTYQLKK